MTTFTEFLLLSTIEANYCLPDPRGLLDSHYRVSWPDLTPRSPCYKAEAAPRTWPGSCDQAANVAT